MKPILCALDFSEASSAVMKVGFEMAKQFETSLTILFVYRLVQPLNGGIAEHRKGIETRAKQDFEALMANLKVNPQVTYEFRPEIGFLSDRLEAYDQQDSMGLVVMSRDMAGTINEHKSLAWVDFMKTLKVPLVVVP